MRIIVWLPVGRTCTRMVRYVSAMLGFTGGLILRVGLVILCVESVEGPPQMNVPSAKTSMQTSALFQVPAPVKRVISPTLTLIPVPYATPLATTAQGLVQTPATSVSPL